MNVVRSLLKSSESNIYLSQCSSPPDVRKEFLQSFQKLHRMKKMEPVHGQLNNDDNIVTMWKAIFKFAARDEPLK